jgi:hypothetical protein
MRCTKKSSVLMQSSTCREGVNQGDKELGSWLRSNTQATIVLLANKAEKQGRAGIQSEPFPLASLFYVSLLWICGGSGASFLSTKADYGATLPAPCSIENEDNTFPVQGLGAHHMQQCKQAYVLLS